jgi:glucose/arabinose dehydrogenase
VFGRLPGRAAIVVLPDDDHDGTADTVQDYMGGLRETVGLLFTGGYLYYQDGTKIMRVPHAGGDRTASGDREEVADITVYSSALHWPKALDVADDGTIYVTNGGDEMPLPQPCDLSILPFEGGILKLDGTPGGAIVARGFRNPISLRCVRGHNLCFAIELTRDNSTPQGGREKLLPIRENDHWGFPCCATKDRPYDGLSPAPDCSGVAAEIDSFFVGNTPFDLDYELGRWPEPWGNRAYVALHGAYSSWAGLRLVAIGLDAMTGQVLPGSDLPGMESGAMVDFATGWENGPRPVGKGRPTVVAFAPDGRLFMGNDTNGDIIWIAPMGLAPMAD